MFYIEKSNFTELIPMIIDISDQMVANGFTIRYPLTNGVFVKPDVSAITAGQSAPSLVKTPGGNTVAVATGFKAPGSGTITTPMVNASGKFELSDWAGSSGSQSNLELSLGVRTQKLTISITDKRWREPTSIIGERLSNQTWLDGNNGGSNAATPGGVEIDYEISTDISASKMTGTLFIPKVWYTATAEDSQYAGGGLTHFTVTTEELSYYTRPGVREAITPLLNINPILGAPAYFKLKLNAKHKQAGVPADEETWSLDTTNTDEVKIGDFMTFDINDPTNGFIDSFGRGKIIFETTSTASNALHSTQPWRVCFEVFQKITKPSGTTAMTDLTRPQLLAVYAGTSLNLDSTAPLSQDVVKCTTRFAGAQKNLIRKNEPMGNMGSAWTNTGTTDDLDALPDHTQPNQGFFNRYLTVKDGVNGGAYPMGYNLVITSRGLFLSINETSLSQRDPRLSWFVIQRAVDKDTGVIRGTTAGSTSRCPVFCVNSVEADELDNADSGNADTTTTGPTDIAEYYKFVVREKDMQAPSKRSRADIDEEDSAAVINNYPQVSFNENGDYVVTFLNNLNTPHFKYTDELDMVGTISADVVGYNQTLNFTVYGEAQPRTYKVLSANSVNGTGMRLVILTDNPNEA